VRRAADAPEVVMTLVYSLIWGATIIFGATAVAALAWAAQTGQMRDPARGARSIFDAEEPIGQVTDAFPGAATRPDQAGQGLA
jgi:nitrogen fixation-related uncharacterized protein